MNGKEDLDQWLAEAAVENRIATPYLRGDDNLDGIVNASDLNALGQNWLGNPNAWQLGDFTADGTVDAGDLNEIGQNWLASIPVASSRMTAVPEPTTYLMWIPFALITIVVRRWRQPTSIHDGVRVALVNTAK